MKTISDAAMTAIEAGEAVVSGAVVIAPLTGDPIYLWGGYGPITIDGNVYDGLGDKGVAQQTAGTIGGVAQGLTIGLSGIEAVVLDQVDMAGIKGASVVLRRLIFASDCRTLLDSAVWDRGRVDTISKDETIGGPAAVNLSVESAARGLGRSGARQRADWDQRLINANDGYFKFTDYAAYKELYWGGKKPSTGGGLFGFAGAVGLSG